MSYRRNAIECVRIADETISARSRVLLIHMAESWMRLSQQAEKNLTTDLLSETPHRVLAPVLQERPQQQVQPKTNGDGTFLTRRLLSPKFDSLTVLITRIGSSHHRQRPMVRRRWLRATCAAACETGDGHAHQRILGRLEI